MKPQSHYLLSHKTQKTPESRFTDVLCFLLCFEVLLTAVYSAVCYRCKMRPYMTHYWPVCLDFSLPFFPPVSPFLTSSSLPSSVSFSAPAFLSTITSVFPSLFSFPCCIFSKLSPPFSSLLSLYFLFSVFVSSLLLCIYVYLCMSMPVFLATSSFSPVTHDS